MLAETLLVCWLIVCAYVPLVLSVTECEPSETARLHNFLRAWEVRRAERLVKCWRAAYPEVAESLHKLQASSQITRRAA